MFIFTNSKFVLFDSLFVTNMYSGPLIVQSMLLNRRSNDKELLIKKGAGGKENDYLGLPGFHEASKSGSMSPSGNYALWWTVWSHFMLSWFCRVKSSCIIMHQYNQVYPLQ